MSDATDLRVPKIGVSVEIALMGAKQRRADLFLSLDSDGEDRVQNLTNLLAGADDFMPVQTGDGIALYRKDAIVWLAVDLNNGDPPIEDAGRELASELFDMRSHVDIALVDQTFLKGDILFSAPPDRRRLVDHLNDSPGFFRVWTSGRFYLVNKRHVLTMRESESK